MRCCCALVQACIRKWGVVWHFSLKAELYGEKRLVGTWVLTQHVLTRRLCDTA